MSNNLTPEQLERLKKILKKESVDYYFFNPKEGSFILSQSERIAELEMWGGSQKKLLAGNQKDIIMLRRDTAYLQSRIAELEKREITLARQMVKLNAILAKIEKIK